MPFLGLTRQRLRLLAKYVPSLSPRAMEFESSICFPFSFFFRKTKLIGKFLGTHTLPITIICANLDGNGFKINNEECYLWAQRKNKLFFKQGLNFFFRNLANIKGTVRFAFNSRFMQIILYFS